MATRSNEQTLIPIQSTDRRLFKLKHEGYGMLSAPVEAEITQLDVLQVMTHLKGRNHRLYMVFKRFIKRCDERENLKTDFERRLPKRRCDGLDD